MTLDELKSLLWGAAVLLRGKINATGYKEYIFPLVFFKRISDVHEEEYRKALELASGDEDFARQPENYSFEIPDKCLWRDIREVTENVGQALVTAWTRIEQANPDRVVGNRVVEGLGGIFGKRDHWTNKNILKDETISELIEHFSKIDLSLKNCPADEMGNAYEYLVGKFADDAGNTAQEFYTNRTVVELMAEILEPKAGESIYDPTCGTGGMLISCIARCKAHEENWREIKAYGQEQNALTSSVARMNLFLHGVEEFRIINDDTLLRPGFLDAGKLKTFDVVLANPPYSIKQWNRELFAHDPYERNFLGTPPQGRADYAFIQHILKSMNTKTGRCAILLPHGVLFREEEKHIRKALIEKDLIEAVIGLAPNLFYNSPMEACVMVCRMNKPAKAKGRILFINAVGEVTRKNAESKLEPSHIKKILKAYHERTSDGRFAYDAAVDEIAAKDWSLAISLYAHAPTVQSAATSGRERDISALLGEFAEAESQTAQSLESLAACFGTSFSLPSLCAGGIPSSSILGRVKSTDAVQRVKFGDVVKEIKEKVDRANNPYEFYVAGDHMDSEDLKIRRKGCFATDDVGPAFVRKFKLGQILYGSRRTYLKKVCVADFEGITANTTFVLESKDENVLHQRLLPFLMLGDSFTTWSIGHSKGSTNPYVLFSDLADYEFTLPPLSRQRELADLLWAANDLKEAYKNAITATDEMLKAKFREMFGDPQTNEKRHEIVSVGNAVELGYIEKPLDGNHGEKHPKASEYVENGIPFVMANDIHDGIVDLKGCSFITEERALRLDKGFAKNGDVLLTHKGTIGHVALLHCDTSFIMLTPQVTYYRPTKKICAEFLRRYFESDWFQRYICRLAGSGSTRAYIGITKQLELPLIIPPLSLQREFVAIADKAESAKANLKKSIAAIDQVMKGLINQ